MKRLSYAAIGLGIVVLGVLSVSPYQPMNWVLDAFMVAGIFLLVMIGRKE